MSFGPFDYGRMVKLEVLSEKSDVTVAAGESVYLPSENGVDISGYKFKTISFYADYALNYVVEVSDDGTFTDYPQYYPEAGSNSIVANRLTTISFEEDYKYLRVKISNPDTSDHTVKRFVVKGRRM